MGGSMGASNSPRMGGMGASKGATMGGGMRGASKGPGMRGGMAGPKGMGGGRGGRGGMGVNRGSGSGGGMSRSNQGRGMGGMGGAARVPAMGSSSLGDFGGGMGGGPDGFGGPSTDLGMRSAAENVHGALSSLSENAGSPRTSRYGQSVRAGSSPSSFDDYRGDRSSTWGNPNNNRSLRDAGVKSGPDSVLGSIAASSQRRIKEIERLIYYNEEGRPGPSVPRTGATIGNFGSEYDRRRYSDGNSRLPLRRSSGRRYDDERSMLHSPSADPYLANEPRKMDGFDSDYDLYDETRYNDENSSLPSQRSSGRNGRPMPPARVADPYLSREPRGMDRFESDYGPYDDRRYDDERSRVPRQRSFGRGYNDEMPRSPRGANPYPANQARRMDRFDSDYDLSDERRYNDERSRLPRQRSSAGPYSSSESRGMDLVDNDYYDSDRMDQFDSDYYDSDRMDQFDNDYDFYESDVSRRGRRNTLGIDKARRTRPPRRMGQLDRDYDAYDRDEIRAPPRPHRGRIMGKRPFGVNRRNIDYQSMNRPMDGSDKENFNTQNRLPTSIGEFDRPRQSKWEGHVGQSLIDYQVKPPRRGRPRDVGRQTRPDFDPIFDDPYFEPY